MLNGHVWQFAGFNEYRLTGIPGSSWTCGGAFTDDQLDTILDEIKSDGGTAVRTWFDQSFWTASGYAGFDRLLSAAAARGLKVIPSLTDEWGSCEHWPSESYRTLAWYQSGYKVPDPDNSMSFRDYAVMIAQHYANDPTIAFWQLVNEAEAMDSANGPCEEQPAAQALRAFADDVGSAMKAVDPNHLLNLGTIGSGQCGAAYTDYAYVYGGAMDILEVHDYSGPGTMPGDQWNGLAERFSQSQALDKPLFEGEVGVDATVNSVTDSTTILARAQAYQAKMEVQFPLGLAGFVIWEYAPPGTPSTGYEVAPGDPVEAMMLNIVQALDAKNGT